MSCKESIDKGDLRGTSRESSAESCANREIILPDPQVLVSAAKISRPKSSGVLRRGRLFRLLDDCRRFPITWVSAPAGSGKTMLIASYLSENKIPCVWYRVDEGDADIATFFYYMGLAAKKAAPRKRRALPLFAPEYLPGIRAFALRYFEKLYSRFKPPFVIIFDNYQDVPAASMFHELICAGLDILPDGIRAILISRENPPPQFARLRVSDKMRFLGADTIRFTFDETRKMVRHKGIKVPSDKMLHELHERTRGWAAGLVLLAENAKTANVSCEFLSSLTPQEIFDYFATEILGKTDPETREFLLKTAFLPGMTVPAAEKLTGIKRSGEILSRLCRDHFFTEKNIQTDPVYRYHPLFREFLLSRAQEVSKPENIRAIRKGAAAVLEESGRIEDVPDLLHAACEWNEMTSFICRHARVLMAQGRNKTLEEWIGKLPEDVSALSPWILYWMGACRLVLNPAESRGFFRNAFDMFLAGEDVPGIFLAWSGAVDSILFGWDDFSLLDPWIEWLDQRMPGDVSFPSPEIGLRVASSMAGALFWRSPCRPDVGVWFERMLGLSRRIGDVNLQIRAMHHAVIYHVWVGDYATLDILTRQGRETALSPDASPLMLALWKVSEPLKKHMSPTDFEESVEDNIEGMEIARKNGVRIFDHLFYANGIYAAFLVNDMSSAAGFLRKLEEFQKGGPRQCTAHYLFLLAWYHLLLGNILRASVLAGQSLRIVLDMGVLPPEILCRHLMAVILCEQGDYDGAWRQLILAEEMALGMGKEGFFYQLCLLTRAYLQLERGEEGAGLESLRQAMALGRKRKHMSMMFCWRPSVMAALCKKALDAGIETDYAENFIRCYNLFPDEPPVEVDNWPWPVKIYTLGRFEIVLEGKPVSFSGKVQKKPLHIIKALIAFGGKEIREERITDLLWPEADGDQAHSAFTTTLMRLRRLLGADEAIKLQEGKLSLNPRCCWVDVCSFEEMLLRTETLLEGTRESGEGGNGAFDAIIAMADKTIDLYGGHFLDVEANQPWVRPLRERLRKRFCRFIVRLGGYLETADRWERAAEYYHQAMEKAEPADEELFQKLMICHYRLGRPARAVEVYRSCVKTLATALGIRPSPKTEAIYRCLVE